MVPGWEICGGIVPGMTLDFNRPAALERLKSHWHVGSVASRLCT